MTFFGIVDAFARTITIKPTLREQVRQNLDPAPGNFHKQMVLESLHYTSKLSTKHWKLPIPQPEFNPIGSDAFNIIKDFTLRRTTQFDDMLFACHELPRDAYARKHIIKAWSRGSKEGLAGIHLSKFRGEDEVKPTRKTYKKLTKEARFEEQSNDAAILLKGAALLPSTLSAVLEIDLCFQRTDGDWHHCANAAKNTLPIIQAAFASNPLSLIISSFTISYQIYNQDYQAVVTTALLTAAFTTGAFIGLPAAILTGGLLIWSGYEAISLAVNAYKVHATKQALTHLDAENICTIVTQENFHSSQYLPYLQSRDQKLLMGIVSSPVGMPCESQVWKLTIERALEEEYASSNAVNMLKEHKTELITEQNFDWILHLAGIYHSHERLVEELVEFTKELLSTKMLVHLLNKVLASSWLYINPSLLEKYKTYIVTEENILWVTNVIEKGYDDGGVYERSEKKSADLLIPLTKELLPQDSISQMLKGIISKKLLSNDYRQETHARQLLNAYKTELITVQNVHWILDAAQTTFVKASCKGCQEFTIAALIFAKDILTAERIMLTTLELVKSVIETKLTSHNHVSVQSAQDLLNNYKDILVTEQNVDWILHTIRDNLQRISSLGCMKFALHLISLTKHIIPKAHKAELLSSAVKTAKIVITKLLASNDLMQESEAKSLLDQYKTELVTTENLPWILDTIKTQVAKLTCQGCKQFAAYLIDSSDLPTEAKVLIQTRVNLILMQAVRAEIEVNLMSESQRIQANAKGLLEQYKTELVIASNLPWILSIIEDYMKSGYRYTERCAFVDYLTNLAKDILPTEEKIQVVQAAINAHLSSDYRQEKAKDLLEQYKTELVIASNLPWILSIIKDYMKSGYRYTERCAFADYLTNLAKDILPTEEKIQVVQAAINAHLSSDYRQEKAENLLEQYKTELVIASNLPWLLRSVEDQAAKVHCQECKTFANHLTTLAQDQLLQQCEKIIWNASFNSESNSDTESCQQLIELVGDTSH